MRKIVCVACLAMTASVISLSLASAQATVDIRDAAKPTATSRPARINKAIELLEQGQPVYYTSGRGGYEEGKNLAQTPSDYINYEMEHGAFDITALREFMRGLVDGGPTRSGHRTPAVIVTLPVLGLDETGMRANSWVVQQVLATGAHGILLCHARSPEAARVMVEASRYPFAPKVAGLDQGFRGSGSQTYAAQIWGIPASEYLRKADPWPLNKEGEILLGVKIEDSYALTNAEKTTRVPGIAFAEWGPGDMGFWLVGLPTAASGSDDEYPPVMLQARARVFKATRDAKIFFLNACNERNVAAMIKEGVMICTGGYEAGRKFTKRQMPW
jgi:4-hydroxy-2-oxoheptanedioate aldolase